MTTGKKVVNYFGSNSKNARCCMEFSMNEDYIFGCDENSTAMVCWDTRTGAVLRKFTAHQGVIGWVATRYRLLG
jgi:cleavage stimulation factor subunit 1